MKKNRYITRRVNSSVITCMVADTISGETYETTVTFPRVFKTDKDMEKALVLAINTDTIKFVCVKNVEFASGIYGISETDFMEKAIRLADER